MDRSAGKPAGRQSFYIAPDVMAWVARYGKAQGIVNGKGEAVLSRTVETILERFMALEEGGQHVSALVDAHTGPLEEKLDVLLRAQTYTLAALTAGQFNSVTEDALAGAEKVIANGWQVVNGGQQE